MPLFDRVLLTNDDGIDAPGLAVAEEIAATLAREVWVSAPADDCSGMSRQVSIHDPLRIIRHGPRRIAVTGSPADSLIVGLRHMMRDAPPDIVLSGINAGTNYSKEVGYSGTVGAALTSSMLGVPAIAMSQAWVTRDELNWDTSRIWLPRAIEKLASLGPWPTCSIYNINIPKVTAEDVSGIELTRLGTQLKLNIDPERRVDHREREYFWLKFKREPVAETGDTDVDALGRNAVSITPIAQDHTDHALYARMLEQF